MTKGKGQEENRKIADRHLVQLSDHIATVRVSVVVDVRDLLTGPLGKFAARGLVPIDVVDAVRAIVVPVRSICENPRRRRRKSLYLVMTMVPTSCSIAYGRNACLLVACASLRKSHTVSGIMKMQMY